MRILIATDAWRPQVNGVVHTLEANAQAARTLGAEVVFLTPEGFPSVAMPSYPGIRLALPRRREIFRRIAGIRPDAIHIATEGPIGHFARWYCVTNQRPFTTSFHTRFTDYASARFPVPVASAALQMFLMASASGMGRDDDASVARLYAKVGGAKLPGEQN